MGTKFSISDEDHARMKQNILHLKEFLEYCDFLYEEYRKLERKFTAILQTIKHFEE